MRKLIESILNDEIPKEENSKVYELIGLLSLSNEKEFKNFLKEFEEIVKKQQPKDVKTKELLEYICTEVKKSSQLGKKTPKTDLSMTTNTSMNSSCINSPEKQSGSGTRWIVSRDERKKILEQMERARDDQKRRKKKNWCRFEQIDEFEAAWNDENLEKGLKERDLEIIRIDEGIFLIPKEPEIKRLRITPETQEFKSGRVTPPKFVDFSIESDITIVDFDCIENLLIGISRSNSEISNSAKFILNLSEDVFKSDLMFYLDLRDFDQPFFMHYAEEDDLRPLKLYNFESDDLGRFCRMKSFKDKSKKFYQERAFRHRYISWKPYNLFFTDSILKRLKFEIENLDSKSKDFHFWLNEIISKKNTIFVSGNPLLKAFSLLLVLSRKIEIPTRQISNSIWSSAKFGTEWTLNEILKKKAPPFYYFTTEKNSKLSHEAVRMRLKFVYK